MSVQKKNNNWEITPNLISDTVLNTKNKYLDSNIIIKSASNIDAATINLDVQITRGDIGSSNIIFGTGTNLSGVSVGVDTIEATATCTALTSGYVAAGVHENKTVSNTNQNTKWIKGLTLNTGKQLEIINDKVDKVTVKYDSTENCLNFIFA